MGSDIHQLTPIGNRLVFSAQVSTANGTDLWVTDGTTAGTTLLKDVASASPFGAIYDLRDSHGQITMLGGDLLFSARGHLSTSFWRTDGTPAGTVQLPIPVGPILTEFVMHGAVLYYIGQTAAAGEELWRWDGTNASLVRDLHTGGADSSPADLTLTPNGGAMPPTLHSTHPQLGGSAVLSGTSPTANVTALVVGIGRGQPFTLAPILPADCSAWIGLTQPSATVLVFGSQWSYQLAIPASTTFTGVRFAAQAVRATTPLALSRALQLRVGN